MPMEREYRFAYCSMLYPGDGSLGIRMALANRSRQFPTAMSRVSPNILYRRALYAMTCVFPPETYNTTGFSALVISLPISISINERGFLQEKLRPMQ